MVEFRAVFSDRKLVARSGISPAEQTGEEKADENGRAPYCHAPAYAGAPCSAGASSVFIINCRSNASLRTRSS